MLWKLKSGVRLQTPMADGSWVARELQAGMVQAVSCHAVLSFRQLVKKNVNGVGEIRALGNLNCKVLSKSHMQFPGWRERYECDQVF
jgi:hypothetical protein